MRTDKTTTRKSWAAMLALLSVLGADRVVLADTLSAFPPDSPPPPPAPTKPEVDGYELRHRMGIQIGGSSYFQIAYRYRVLGGLYLDTGLFALNAGANGSIGAVVDVPIVRPVSVYVGAGAGFALAFGATTPKGCDSSTTDCPVVSGSSGGGYTYARVGTAVRFGRTARHVVGLDVAIWRGQSEEEIDGQVTERNKYLMLVPGLSYHWAF
jgi:hypothetical protein